MLSDAQVQVCLNAAGFGPLTVDGKLGAKSREAIIRFQKLNGMMADGVAGPKTREALAKHLPSAPVPLPPPVASNSGLKYPDFVGPAKKLEDIDLPRIAKEIGAGEDEVHMLLEVETAGSSFDSKGRPKLLFEPHKFYAGLVGAERDEAVRLGLAYPNWGMKPYPKESYTRLGLAMEINPREALEACSWGGPQIMGENFKLADYANVYDMVNAFCEDEDNHIEAMIAFIRSVGLDDDLRRLAALTRPTTPEDCRIIARVYNGPGYEKNKYHEKMATAHNKWRKIANTPLT